MPVGVAASRVYLAVREEPSERPCSMSIHPFRQPRPAVQPPIEPYFSSEPVIVPAPRLRPLTALEQMYAYWGSDREALV